MNRIGPGQIASGILSVAFVMALGAGPASSAATCADVEQAKLALKNQPASTSGYRAGAQRQERGESDVQNRRSQDPQAPRSNEIQAPRKQDEVQAPRKQDEVQAPRQQDEIQAPRKQDEVQAPRQQDEVQAPRGQDNRSGSDAQAPRSPERRQAAALVRQADVACKAGNTAQASEKARAAMALLQK